MNEQEKQLVKYLVETAQSVLEFLEQYPPYFHDGKSMESDLGGCLEDLEFRIERVKEEVLGEQA